MSEGKIIKSSITFFEKFVTDIFSLVVNITYDFIIFLPKVVLAVFTIMLLLEPVGSADDLYQITNFLFENGNLIFLITFLFPILRVLTLTTTSGKSEVNENIHNNSCKSKEYEKRIEPTVNHCAKTNA